MPKILDTINWNCLVETKAVSAEHADDVVRMKNREKAAGLAPYT